jgi:hypothetical protein
MTRLAITSTILGAAIIAGRLPGIIAPDKFIANARKFPRSVLWGRILMGICAVWSGIVLYCFAAVDDFAWLKPVIVIGIPVAYWFVIQYADHFLAIRGLAALLLLISKVTLNAADISDSPARLIVTVLAYLWVCVAVWMASAPHHVRDWVNIVTASATRCRAACSLGAAVGVFLVLLGLFVY